MWSVFFRIWTEHGQIRSISPFSVQIREDADQKNSEYGHYSLFNNGSERLGNKSNNKNAKCKRMQIHCERSHIVFLITRFFVSFIISVLLKIYVLKKLYFAKNFQLITNELNLTCSEGSINSLYVFIFFYIGTHYKVLCLFFLFFTKLLAKTEAGTPGILSKQFPLKKKAVL